MLIGAEVDEMVVTTGDVEGEAKGVVTSFELGEDEGRKEGKLGAAEGDAVGRREGELGTVEGDIVGRRVGDFGAADDVGSREGA